MTPAGTSVWSTSLTRRSEDGATEPSGEDLPGPGAQKKTRGGKRVRAGSSQRPGPTGTERGQTESPGRRAKCADLVGGRGES